MAQRFISALGLLLLATIGNAQAFGRFGYVQSATLPGLLVDKEGFTTKAQGAEKIRFATPSDLWKPISTSETEQVVQLTGQSGNPSKAVFSLLGVGFSLYFEDGIELHTHSQGAPYLSWLEGTVGQTVATPDVRWILLSFRDKQPAVVFGFPDGPASLIVTGKPGDWSIRTPDKFKGWVRVALPDGSDSKLADTVKKLGKLVKDAALHVRLWTTMPPKLLKTSLAEDLYSVTATWQFDHAGAVVPTAAELAFLGGYPLEIRSRTVRMPGGTETGPIDVLKGDSLTIRFPVRRVPTGRALTIGSHPQAVTTPAKPDDLPAISALALNALTDDRDPALRKSAEDTVSDYVSQTGYYMEPWTHQQLPFTQAGLGVDVAAAQAFLMQAVTITSRATSESNSLLTSVSWRRDWLTWRVWAADDALTQRAGAFAALAGALCPEPERRLSAGMFQAGLSARRGLDVWKRREGLIGELPTIKEPLYGVRKALFGLAGPEEDGEAFTRTLLSPLRVFSDTAVHLEKGLKDYTLKIAPAKSKSPVLMLATAYPVEVSAGANVGALKSAAALGFTEVHYVASRPDPCEMVLSLPSYGKIPPLSVPVPAYSEPDR